MDGLADKLEDWQLLYQFARESLPETYRCLVNIDLLITRGVHTGKGLDDPEMVESVAEHRRVLGALRALIQYERN